MSSGNKRPTTPNLKATGAAAGAGTGGALDPASPPQTPTSASPLLNHHHRAANAKASSRAHNQANDQAKASLPRRSHIRPTGVGHQFSFTRGVNHNRFAQLSPQSSSEEDSESEEDEDSEGAMPASSSGEEESEDEDEDGASSGSSSASESTGDPAGFEQVSSEDEEEDGEEDTAGQTGPTVVQVGIATTSSVTIEELSDLDPMNDNRSDIVQPTGYESPESDRSRSRSRPRPGPHHEGAPSSPLDRRASPRADEDHQHPRLPHRPRMRHVPRCPELDKGMMEHLRDLSCRGEGEGEAEDDILDAEDDADLADFILAQRERRMRMRRTHGSSVGKRTHSERSDDSDREDLLDEAAGGSPAAWDAPGASARRMRRRVGDRRSLQFHDPPLERIEEMRTRAEEAEEAEDGCGYCEEDEGEGEGERGVRGPRGVDAAVTRGLGMLFEGADLARELPYYGLEIMEMDEEV